MAEAGKPQAAALRKHRAHAGDIQHGTQDHPQGRCAATLPHRAAPACRFDAEKQQKRCDVADQQPARPGASRVTGFPDQADASDGGESPCRVELIRHHDQSEDGEQDEGDLASFDRGDGGLDAAGPITSVAAISTDRPVTSSQPIQAAVMAPGQHDASVVKQRTDQFGQQPRSQPGGGQRSHGKTGDRDQRLGFPGSGQVVMTTVWRVVLKKGFTREGMVRVRAALRCSTATGVSGSGGARREAGCSTFPARQDAGRTTAERRKKRFYWLCVSDGDTFDYAVSLTD